MAPSEIDIGGREVAQALVITTVIVARDESLDLSLEAAGQIVVLQQDPVLQGPIPSLYLAPGLGMVSGTACLKLISSGMSFPRFRRLGIGVSSYGTSL